MKSPLILLGLALALALLLVLTDTGDRQAAAPSSSAVATVPAEADASVGQLVLQRCGGCHSLDTLSHNPQDAAGWTKTVDTMVQMGAQVAPQERAPLIDYLARHFGK